VEDSVVTSTSSALAWGGVLLAGAFWGGGAVVGRLLIEGGISPLSLALARFSLGLPLLWCMCLSRPSPARVGQLRERRAALGWRGGALVIGTGIAMALSVACWFAGIAALGASLATVIAICCAPVVVALVSLVRGYERMTGWLVLALCMSLIGVGLLVLPAGGLVLSSGYRAGLAWSFAAAGLQAMVVLGNARMPAQLPAATASAWGMTAAACCIAALALPRGVTLPAGTLAWLGAAYMGVVTTSVAYALFAWGARRLTPTAAAIGIMVEPLVATLLAAGLLAESLVARQWLGAALLGAAVLPLSRIIVRTDN
jgi:DME family drug/metabolite transporter